MQQISLGGFFEWETTDYFCPLFVHFKTLLTTLTNSAMNCFPNLGPKFSDWIHWHEFKGHRSLKRNNSMQKSSYVRRRHPLLTSQEVLVPIEVRANLWGGNVITVVWGELNYWALVGGDQMLQRYREWAQKEYKTNLFKFTNRRNIITGDS